MNRTIAGAALPCFLACSMALAGCFDVQEYLDFQLNVSPFDSSYLDRGEATMEIWLMDGYYCPDDQLARIYLLYSNVIETPAPMAVVLHPEAFDYVRSDGTTYSSTEGIDRLTVEWAAGAAEEMMGLRDSGPQAYQSGSLIAELVHQGFYVVVPTNCWGDLWHNTGDNDYSEGFMRNGLYMADDAIKWGLDQVDVDESRVLLAGLGEGGRGVVDLMLYGWTDQAILIDSSPDYLPPIFGDPANDEFIVGLERIYGGEEMTEQEFQDLLAQLSLYGLVTSGGFVQPTIYVYSANDDFVDVSLTRPAKTAIEDTYPTGLYYEEMEVAENRHIITNTARSAAESVVDWLTDGWDGDFPSY